MKLPGFVMTIVISIAAGSCMDSADSMDSVDVEDELWLASELAEDEAAGLAEAPTWIDTTLDEQANSSCFWTGWACGRMECPGSYYVRSVDFNATRSEECWGRGNDFDEPFRRLQCCSSPAAKHQGCFWSGWRCGAVTCPAGNFMAGVDFNIQRSEDCWGRGNDFDEPFRQIECCNGDMSGGACYWTGWGCGAMSCAPGHYVAGVDFNATRSEGCWGRGNDFDEPFRRLRCCPE